MPPGGDLKGKTGTVKVTGGAKKVLPKGSAIANDEFDHLLHGGEGVEGPAGVAGGDEAVERRKTR